MTYALGYGTNGFANHRIEDAIAVIADLGYTGIALTLDHDHLDPFAADIAARTWKLGAELDRRGLKVVVETGARYLLDPNRKHHPTLVSEDQERRIDFLVRAARIATDLGADCVSFWSGIGPAQTWPRLRDGVAELLDRTDNVLFGLEPEPGMLVETLDDALRLREELGRPDRLRITLDVGHCVAVEPLDAAECVRRAGDLLVNVQLDDMLPGVHEHLEFGDGALDLPATLAALDEIGYTGLAAVELPRHSHAAPDVARRAFIALTAARTPHPWLDDAERAVRETPAAIRTLFPAVSRNLRDATRDDEARVRLIAALADSVTNSATGSATDLGTEVRALYDYGDSAERRAVLRGLDRVGWRIQEVGAAIVKDALRTNDTTLVAAALGGFADTHLDQHSWRHGVLKCLFTGVPLAEVAGLDRRTDDELIRMVRAFADERDAAGREVPADAVDLLRSQV
ncbi:MAG TPA: EboA domain-containing protein [Actinokineospora sp.]|nr:EboA domain-containing protein [Actinokineospora sp.]